MKRKNKRKVLVVFLLVATFLIVLVTFYNKFFTINGVECKSQYGSCDSNIQLMLEQASGKPLFSSRKILTDVLRGSAFVKDFSIQLRLPLSYEVSVIERKPIFALKKSDNTAYSLVSGDGVVLSKQDSSSLPYIILDGEIPRVSEKVSNEILFSLQLMREVDRSFEIEVVSKTTESLVIDLVSGERVIFPIRGDKKMLLGSLILIMNELKGSEKSKIGVEKVSQIDLRFKNPVLTISS